MDNNVSRDVLKKSLSRETSPRRLNLNNLGPGISALRNSGTGRGVSSVQGSPFRREERGRGIDSIRDFYNRHMSLDRKDLKSDLTIQKVEEFPTRKSVDNINQTNETEAFDLKAGSSKRFLLIS